MQGKYKEAEKQGGADRNAFSTNNSHRYNHGHRHHQSHQGLSHADLIMGRGRPVKTLSAGVVLILKIVTMFIIKHKIKCQIVQKRAAFPTPPNCLGYTGPHFSQTNTTNHEEKKHNTTLLEHFLGHLPMCPMCCLFVQ